MECVNCHMFFESKYSIVRSYCSYKCQIDYAFINFPEHILNGMIDNALFHNSIYTDDEYYTSITKNQQNIINKIKSDQFQHKQQHNKRSNFVGMYLTKHLIKDIANIVMSY